MDAVVLVDNVHLDIYVGQMESATQHVSQTAKKNNVVLMVVVDSVEHAMMMSIAIMENVFHLYLAWTL